MGQMQRHPVDPKHAVTLQLIKAPFEQEFWKVFSGEVDGVPRLITAAHTTGFMRYAHAATYPVYTGRYTPEPRVPSP